MRRSPSSVVMTAIAAAAAALSAAAFVAVVLSSQTGNQQALIALGHVLLIAAPVAAGLYALQRAPDSRFARLLIAAGFLWAPTLLAVSGNSALYSIGRIAGWVMQLSLIALVLAFPAGRLTGRADRALVVTAGALVAVLYLPTALLSADYPSPNPLNVCEHHCPPNAFAVTNSEPHVIGSVVNPLREMAAVLLWIGVAGALSLRIRGASRLMRRTLAPVLTAAIVAFLANVAFVIARRIDQWSSVTRALGFVALLAVPGVVVGFLWGLVRWRLAATSALRRLTEDFGHASSGSRLRDLISHAIDDPSLEIAYWSAESGRWVDGAGRPVNLPRGDPARAVTEVGNHGQPVAALIHDAAHIGEPAVGHAAGGFALMALENQRLQAQLRSSLRELRESRARILTAVDLERERIERDLHDGAQQRLVALRVGLQVAGEMVEQDPHAAGELLHRLGVDVEATLDDVRSLARGVYPPLLADHGIAEALRMAAGASPLPTTVDTRGVGRYSQHIESAVYFACLEALQNAAKHAAARSAEITLTEDDELHFEVRDDGRGFDVESTSGVGLDNMRERIASLGGRLTIASAAGEGTRVIGTVPLGLAQLTRGAAMLFQRATDALDDCFGIYRAVRDSHGAVVDFTVEHLNDAACRDTGRPREAQVGRTLGSLDPQYLGSERFAWHRHALEAEEPSSLEELVYDTSAQGRRLSKAYEHRAVQLGAGRLGVIWREITERKRKENELLLQSRVLDRAAEGVCLVRASDGVIVYANPRFAEIYGYEPGELDGRHMSQLNWEDKPGDAERQASEIFARLDEHGAASVEIRNRRKDGSPVWSEAHIASFDHPDHGRVWVAVQQDVTARKSAEEALRRSEERVHLAAQVAPLVLYTMDRDLRYTWVFNNQVGLDGDDRLIGKTDRELFGREVARVLARVNRQALAGRQVRTELELDLPRGRSTFDLAVAPLKDWQGNVVGLAGAAWDVTPAPARSDWGRPAALR